MLSCYIEHMKIHRHNGQPNPYQVTFEQHPTSGFREQIVAKNALMLGTLDIERLGMTDSEVGEWEPLGFQLSRQENGQPVTSELRLSKDRLKRFGGLLAYYSSTTEEEVYRISCNNPPSKDMLAARRVEGRMAESMHEVIAARVTVPALWTPSVRQFPLGFTSQHSSRHLTV